MIANAFLGLAYPQSLGNFACSVHPAAEMVLPIISFAAGSTEHAKFPEEEEGG